MSVEDKFHAAVNVIRSLPKNGSYQPSHDLMLRFYAYYKQATEGPNRSSKPAFWEVVKKAKWEAWSRLGTMPSRHAMAAYVDELNKIVETMAYTDNVADFLNSLDSFYSRVPAQDLEMCIGPVLDRVRSQPGSPLSHSPLGSRDTSPIRIPNRKVESRASSPTDEEDDDDFLDTLEQAEEDKHNREQESAVTAVSSKTTFTNNMPNGLVHGKMDNVAIAIEKAVEGLHYDITSINERLRKLEEKHKTVWRGWGRGRWGLALLLWPLLLQLGLHLWRRRRRAPPTSYS